MKKTLGVFLASLYLIFLNRHIDVRGFNSHDPAAYVNRAVSLWQGRGYGETFANGFLPVTMQPPFFSLLLAPVVGLFGINFAALKLFMVLLAAGFGVSSFYFFRYFLKSSAQAGLAAFMLMSSPVIFGLSHRVLAEIPLFAFTVLGLLALDRYLRDERAVSIKLFAAAFCTVAACFFKFTAMAIVAGGWLLWVRYVIANPPQEGEAISRRDCFASLAMTKRRLFAKLCLFTAITAVPLIVWSKWVASVPDVWMWTHPFTNNFLLTQPFMNDSARLTLADFMLRIRHNLVWGLASNSAGILLPPLYWIEGSLAAFLISVPVLGWVVFQGISSWRREPSVLEGFALFSALLLMPVYLGMAARYAAVLYPSILVYAFRGFAAIHFSRLRSFLVFTAVAASLAMTLIEAVDQKANPYGSPLVRQYVTLAEDAKRLFPAKALCYAPMSTHWQLLTGHSCFEEEAHRGDKSRFRPEADYYLTLSPKAPKNLEAFRDLEGDLMQGAFKVSEQLAGRPTHVEILSQNEFFALVRQREPLRHA